MKARGIDLSQATRQDMRTYVCAQCHVEYYFAGDTQVAGVPVDQKGWRSRISRNITTRFGFKDWVHKDSGAPMLKMQHPEFEMWSSGIHAKSGVTCADCHMPYVREGAIKVSDHWVRSPLTDLSRACQTCHRQSEAELKSRVLDIQNKTHDLIDKTESAIVDAIDVIAAAQKSGATDAELAKAARFSSQSKYAVGFRVVGEQHGAFTVRKKLRGFLRRQSTMRGKRRWRR